MHGSAYEILYLALDKTRAKITVQTNGTIIQPDKIRSFDKKRIGFSVSIDGFEKDHDIRRGAGSYKRTFGNSKELISNGFHVSALVTLDKRNQPYLPELIDYLFRFFPRVTLLCIANTGAAHREKNELGLDEEFLSNTVSLVYRQITPRTMNKRRCRVFPESISIKYDGTVFPCSVARDMNLFPMGNVDKTNLPSILNKFCFSEIGMSLLNYTSPEEIGECSVCPKNEMCNRGCRIRAYKWNDDIKTPDPFACKVYMGKFECKNISDVFWGVKNLEV